MNIHTVGCEASQGHNCHKKPFLFDRIRVLSDEEFQCAQEVATDPEKLALKEASVECLGKSATGECIYTESAPEVIRIKGADAFLAEIVE